MDNIKTILKTVLIVGLAGIAIFVIWKKFFGSNDNSDDGYISVPKGMQINYVPADFRSTLNEEEVMQILSNPSMYRRDFNKMVYNLNMDLLDHVSRRMGLPDTLRTQVEGEYRKHHNYLKDLYYHDFLQLQDTTSAIYQQWYANDASNMVDALNEVASKYTCFLVNHVMTTLLKSGNGALSVKGRKVYSPCSIAMEEGLKPMVKRMQEKAVIDDFNQSKGMLEERVERSIAELATIEVRDKKGASKELKTKVLGYSVSSTEIEITAISIAKIGFKLDELFEIQTNSSRKEVVVILPEPRVLSHEVYPKIDKLDVGWMREVKNEDLNTVFNLLREEFRRDLNDTQVMNRSKKHAEKIMQTMLLPMIQSIDPRYNLKVKFRGSGMQQNL